MLTATNGHCAGHAQRKDSDRKCTVCCVNACEQQHAGKLIKKGPDRLTDVNVEYKTFNGKRHV